MPDFRIVDTAEQHPKLRAAGLAAAGLWSMAGARAMKDLTDGWIPEHWVVGWPSGKRHATTLVKVGLWVREERKGVPGYRFHDWRQVQRSVSQIQTERARSRESKAASRRGSAQSGSPSRPSDVPPGHARDTPRDSHSDSNGTTGGSPNGVPPMSLPESTGAPYPQHPEGVLGEGSSGWQRAGTATIPPSNDLSDMPDIDELERQPCGRRHSSADPCGGCGQARRLQADQDRADEQKRRDAQAVIDACGMCDRDGFLREVNSARPVSPYTKCDHRTDHRQQVADAKDEPA